MSEKIITDGLTEQDEKTVIELLGRVGPRWSPAFYNAVASKVVVTTIELVCLRVEVNGWYALLLPRLMNDPFYPGMWHSPGTVLRYSDTSHSAALQRIISMELGCRLEFVSPIVHRRSEHRIFATPRGPESPVIYSTQICTSTLAEGIMLRCGGQFYRISTTCKPVEFYWPNNMIEHHKWIISEAIRSYVNLETTVTS